jgi:biopolymer transport protein ExbD
MSYYGYIRERKLPPEPSARPQITSFADVTLALLVIFLVTASAALQLIPVALPDAENTSARDVAIARTVSVTKDGKFYYEEDDTPIEGKNLWAALKDIKASDDWPRAMIRADKDTPCEHLTILVTCLQGLGVDEICFVMKEEGAPGG